MRTHVIVLDLDHRLSGFVGELGEMLAFSCIHYRHIRRKVTYLTLDLCNICTGPSLVRPHCNDSLSIDTTL